MKREDIEIATKIFMDAQKLECLNNNYFTLPERWQLEAMRNFANKKIEEASESATVLYNYHKESTCKAIVNKYSILKFKV